MGLLSHKPSSSETDVRHLIAMLSEQLHVPAEQVGALYCEQLDRLSAEARIPDFLVVLALRNARAILRAGTTGSDKRSANAGSSEKDTGLR